MTTDTSALPSYPSSSDEAALYCRECAGELVEDTSPGVLLHLGSGQEDGNDGPDLDADHAAVLDPALDEL